MAKEYIHRMLDLKDILEDGSQFLFGPRQTGKSSYIRNELKEDSVLYWNLLDVSLVARIKANPSLLRNQLRMIGKKSGLVILDEIQKVPFLLDEIHSLIEETDFHFLLTGSSARRLREKGVNLLGGRAGVSYMHPLVYPEVKELDFGLEKVFERGLMPSIYLSSRYDILLRNYIKAYLQEEIMEEGITRNLPTFTDFLRIAAINNTEMVNFSNMANDIGVNRAVVTEWYQVLKDSMVITEVPGYGRTRKRKAITKSKYYFFDVGVARKAIGAAPPADGTGALACRATSPPPLHSRAPSRSPAHRPRTPDSTGSSSRPCCPVRLSDVRRNTVRGRGSTSASASASRQRTASRRR